MNQRLHKFFDRLKISSLYGLTNLSTVLSQLVLSLLIIKLKSVELWGVYVEVWLWLQLIVLFSYFGNRTYLLKSFSEQPSQIYPTWYSNLLSRFLLFLVSALFITTIPLFAAHIWWILLWAFLLFYNQSFEVLILYQRDFRFSLIAELTKNLYIITAVFIFIGNLDLELLILFIATGALIRALFNTAYYFKHIYLLKPRLDLLSLKRSIPFFIPMILGTIRTKIDAYYGTVYFSKTELSRYQVFINMMALVQLGTTYAINPFLKTFYRITDKTRRLIEKQFVFAGIVLGIISVPVIYLITMGVYNFTFSLTSYFYLFLFIITLFIHLLFINEFYKKDKQMTVAIIIAITALVQIILGYYVIKIAKTEGALAIKVLGQWIMVVALYIYKRRIL